MTNPDPDPLEPEIEAFYQLALARYGDRLTTDDERARVRNAVARLRRGAAAMAAFELANWDEPATSFGAGAGS